MNANEAKFIGRAQDGGAGTDKELDDLNPNDPVISDIVEAELDRFLSDEKEGR